MIEIDNRATALSDQGFQPVSEVGWVSKPDRAFQTDGPRELFYANGTPLQKIKFIYACLLLLAGSVVSGPVFSQAIHTVDGIYPQGGQLGTTVEVTIEGAYLHQPTDVLFYQPGIRCTKIVSIDRVPDHKTGNPKEAKPGAAARMTLEISSDAALGEHLLRVLTRDNLSEVVTFWVTPFPIVNEKYAFQDRTEKEIELRNDSPEFAQEIPLNCTVAGYMGHYLAQDDDWYSVSCEAGQRLSVEVFGARLGTWNNSGMNDSAVSIVASDGKVLANNDDNALHTQDPVVSVMIPKTGKYYIHLRQQMDYESLMRHYLIHVGTFARPMVLFPLGGKVGGKVAETLPVKLFGEALIEKSAEVKLPGKVGLFEDSYVPYFHREGNSPAPVWPNRIHLSTLSDVFESNTNSTEETPQPIKDALPLAINGCIQAAGEVDWYRFTAKKGQRFRVRTYGKTLDSELDAKVFIRPAPGNDSKKSYEEDDSLWDAHDLVGHHYRWQIKDRMDPIFMFEPDTDDDWLIGIADTQRNSGPRHVYRIEFQPHVESAFVFFPAYSRSPMIGRDRIVLFPGHSVCRPLGIQRGLGSNYDGWLQLRVENLPKGVTIEVPPFKQSDSQVSMMVSAEPKTELGARTLEFVVQPVEESDRDSFIGGFVQVNPATNRRGDYAMYFVRTRKVAMAVVEGAGFKLRVVGPKVPLVRNGEISLDVHVQRDEEFAGAVYCEADWLPKGVNKQPPLIIPAGESSGKYKLSAAGNADQGDFSISITGRENEGGSHVTGAGFHYVSSPFVKLKIGQPYVKIGLVRSAIERGKVGEIEAEIEHLKPFSGVAEIQLGRLPFGVKQVKPFPSIKAGQTSAAIKVEVTKDCLIGQYKDIYCEVTVHESGQPIRQQTGSGVLRVDQERNQ